MDRGCFYHCLAYIGSKYGSRTLPTCCLMITGMEVFRRMTTVTGLITKMMRKAQARFFPIPTRKKAMWGNPILLPSGSCPASTDIESLCLIGVVVVLHVCPLSRLLGLPDRLWRRANGLLDTAQRYGGGGAAVSN